MSPAAIDRGRYGVAGDKAPRSVRCPTCGTQVEWSARSSWRPFCSERCRTIDFGAWAAERYRVIGPGHEPEASG